MLVERAEALENIGLAHRKKQKVELVDDLPMAPLCKIHSWVSRYVWRCLSCRALPLFMTSIYRNNLGSFFHNRNGFLQSFHINLVVIRIGIKIFSARQRHCRSEI